MWIARKPFSHLPLAKLKICDCVHNPYTSIIFHGNICYLNIMQAVPCLMNVCSCSQNFKISTRSSCTLLKKPIINFTNVFNHVTFFWSYWWLFWSKERIVSTHDTLITPEFTILVGKIQNMWLLCLFPIAIFQLRTEFLLKQNKTYLAWWQLNKIGFCVHI